MADFNLDKKYNYNWQSSKFKDLALSGSYISQFINDAGYVTSSNASSASYATSASYALTASYFSGSISNAVSASYALTASYALNGGSGTPINTGSFVTTSSFNAFTSSYSTGSFTGSFLGTASYALNGGVTKIIAGTNITISPTNGLGNVTINSSGGSSGSGSNAYAPFTSSPTWTFTHGLNNQYVIVQTLDSSFNQIIPQSITLTDANTATITFPSSQSGYAIATLGGLGVSASYAATASYVQNAQTASYVLQAVSSSFATTALSASYALSASFASTVPASGVIGLNLTQIATSSFSASVSPTQFTVTSASITEFSVAGTGVTIGNAITDTHRVTGSLNVTGSQTIVGTLTATRIGAGAAPSGSIPLDVRAQGALSTDVIFRVRNSANTSNMITITGDTNLNVGSNTAGTLAGTLNVYSGFSGGDFLKLICDTTSFGVYHGLDMTSTGRSGYFALETAGNQGSSITRFRGGGSTSGNAKITAYIDHPGDTDKQGQWQFRTQVHLGDAYRTYRSTLGNHTFLQETGSAPTTSSANAFIMYATASTVGNAQPAFRTENGTIVWIGSESRLFNVTASNLILSGSATIGFTSSVSTENTLTLGPPPAGGAGEGGQLGLAAAGGSYTSASMLDTWQNQFRILRGTNAGSNAGLMYMDLQTGNTQFVGAVTASAYSGLPNDYLYATRSGSAQTVGANWISQDIIFNNTVVSKGITYNTGTGLASLTGGKVYRVTARLAWSAAATYNLQFSCYTSANVQIGPTVEIIQSTNGTNNISDGTLEFIYAPGSNTDIKIRTTSANTALSGETVRADLNTQFIIQQIA